MTPATRAAVTAAAAASHAAAAASTAAAAASTAASAAASAAGDAASQVEPPAETPVCDAATSAVRYESWGKHFAVYEELATGDLVRLGMDSQFVDEYSAIVIRRITDEPEIRSANSEIRAEWDDPKGLDVDIVVLRPSATERDGVCRVRVRTPGLQTTGGYDRAEREPPGCPPNYDYFTQPGAIGKDAQWRIPAGTFRHGDKVEMQFRGRVIGREPNNVPTKTKVSVPGMTEEVDSFYVAQRTICGQQWTANFRRGRFRTDRAAAGAAWSVDRARRPP